MPALAALGAVAALLAPATARADTEAFTVDWTGDATDIAPDGICDTDGTPAVSCTLRAAIQEAEDGDATDLDTIGFSGVPVGATIQLFTALPTINERVTINGCSLTPNNAGPCVGVRGSGIAGHVALQVQGDSVTVRGLAITNSGVGINGLLGGSNMTVRNNWLGVDLAGVTEGNGTGVQVTDDDATIGGTAGAPGTSPADRNVIAGGFDGINVFADADDLLVQGNYIGVKADGTTSAANNQGIAFGAASPGAVPDDAIIGGTAPAPGTCTGPCNVISASTADGIDLRSTGTDEPNNVTISGNFVGLDSSGTGVLGNVSNGIRVVNAPSTLIGGPAAGDRNYVSGGANGIFSNFQGAPDLVIQNNLVGVSPSGAAALGPPSSNGISVNSLDAVGATLSGNRIAVDASAPNAIALSGDDADVSGNAIGVGAGGQDLGDTQIGIRSVALDDSTITGNTIGNITLYALSLENSDGNTVQGNLIGVDAAGNPHPVATRGIEISSFAGDSLNNLIGGDTAAEENVVSNVAGDAIQLQDDDGNDGNLIERNRGTGNTLFTDLGGDGFGNGALGPNGGIEAPGIATATDDRVTGTAAPGATIRVFRAAGAAGAAPTGVTAFAGTATASAGGTWQLDASLGNGIPLAASQTAASGSSELSLIATTVPDPPETTITAAPKAKQKTKKKSVSVSFSFSSDEPGEGGFQCQLDNAEFVLCSSPFTAKVKRGSHTFRVRAFDAASNPDPTLATHSFKVVKKKKKKK